MNADTLYRCWQCGAELTGLIFPVSRREECAACRAEIHVCRMCRHYDPRVSDQCREERAEAVTDKTRANFCDYYDISPDAWQAGDKGGQSSARSAAEALFGEHAESVSDDSGSEDKAKEELKRLFGEDS